MQEFQVLERVYGTLAKIRFQAFLKTQKFWGILKPYDFLGTRNAIKVAQNLNKFWSYVVPRGVFCENHFPKLFF